MITRNRTVRVAKTSGKPGPGRPKKGQRSSASAGQGLEKDEEEETEAWRCQNRGFWCCETCCPNVRAAIKSGKKGTKGKGSGKGKEAQEVQETVREMKKFMEDFETKMVAKIEFAVEKAITETGRKQILGEGVLEDECITMAKVVAGVSPQSAAGPSVKEPPKKNIPSMKNILREAMQEKDAMRKRNVIIHGLPEKKTNNREERKKENEQHIERIMDALELNLEIENFYRLGKLPNEDADREHTISRPLKLCFNSEDKVKMFMGRLNKLGEAEEDIKRIRVQHNMNLQERAEIRELVQEAKNLTLTEWRLCTHRERKKDNQSESQKERFPLLLFPFKFVAIFDSTLYN
ncbi:hypothetical protein CAPTEDRAFT_206647 [Capitella teleta]|uniref:Uncharacterized protein n=1 Tax=Capitella teleta TaxID=283909 RepID=R7TPR5_CAPTE|nr:hypothetical protein CAPTEDRAFT_206647 [Capitella teleta]|eukprot:ELT95853.1 hypothetical protein CAPTEDRAFT_206647 [Capitella teleta]